jgi:hypothetical protein
MSETAVNNWHLDKRVNVSIILVLLGQLILGAWYASKMESRVAVVEEKVVNLQRNEDEDRKTAAAIKEDLREIKTMLRVLSDKERR